MKLDHEHAGDGLDYQLKLFNSEQPIFVADKPTVHVKPIKPASHGYRHLLVLMLATFLIIAGTVGSTFNAVTSRLAQLSGSFTTTVTPSVAPVDLLAYDDRWPTSKTFFFKGPDQNYHIVNTSASQGALALYYHHPFANFRLTVTMQEVQKSPASADYYGVIFRATSDQSHYYLFEVAPSQGNHYAFLRYDQQWTTIVDGTASSLVAGPTKRIR